MKPTDPDVSDIMTRPSDTPSQPDDAEQTVERVMGLINPDVLAEVLRRIAEKEQQERENPYLYRRYLEMHADFVIEEAMKLAAQAKHPAIEPDSPAS